MTDHDIEVITPRNAAAWRKWLQANHLKKQSVWVIKYKKSAGIETVSWSEAVDEALCFGWIDSKKQSIDEEKYRQFYSRRKANSTWSKINKAKVKRLIDEGLMTPAGLESIEVAKENGSWTLLDAVEELIIPPDLEAAFQKQPGSKAFFNSQSKSTRKLILYWVVSAKRQPTRDKRVKEVAECAAEELKPKPFR